MDWATPTPFPTPSVPVPLDMSDFNLTMVEVTEQIVSTWQMGNRDFFLDWAIMIVLLIATLRAYYWIFKQIKEL